MPRDTPPSVTIWRFLDGKTGHRNQVIGLSDAIGRIGPTVCVDVDVSRSLRGMRSLIPGRLRSLDSLCSPSLLIGAGHATHLPMLAAKRRFGGRTIVLMKPSLPLMLFDLGLIPAGDGLKRTPKNVIVTEGALNRILPSQRLDAGRGLILIGGPSDHFGWCDRDVLGQVRTVIAHHPEIEWKVTTSRRTPVSFVDAWTASGCRGQLVPVDQTDADWLPAQLQSAATVWVTRESVSMVYEALTSGACVGILDLPRLRESRVTRGIDSLISRNLVTPYERWLQTFVVQNSRTALNEADRCAELVMARLLRSTAAQADHSRRAA